MFIFVRCLRSSAVVTPVMYERDIIQVTNVFIILINWENNQWCNNAHSCMTAWWVWLREDMS